MIDDENHSGSVSQDSSAAKTLAATLGSIEKTEDVHPTLLLAKDSSNIPIVQTDTGSDGDLSPSDETNEINFTLKRCEILAIILLSIFVTINLQ